MNHEGRGEGPPLLARETAGFNALPSFLSLGSRGIPMSFYGRTGLLAVLLTLSLAIHTSPVIAQGAGAGSTGPIPRPLTPDEALKKIEAQM